MASGSRPLTVISMKFSWWEEAIINSTNMWAIEQILYCTPLVTVNQFPVFGMNMAHMARPKYENVNAPRQWFYHQMQLFLSAGRCGQSVRSIP
jgi:hypothetical protein